ERRGQDLWPNRAVDLPKRDLERNDRASCDRCEEGSEAGFSASAVTSLAGPFPANAFPHVDRGGRDQVGARYRSGGTPCGAWTSRKFVGCEEKSTRAGQKRERSARQWEPSASGWTAFAAAR